MAFGGTITHRGSFAGLYGWTSKTGGDTFTPAVDDLILVIAFHTNDADRLNGCSADWGTLSQIAERDSANQKGTLELWACRASSASADNVTATRASGTDSTSFNVVQITGAKTDGTLASVFQQTQATDSGTSFNTSNSPWEMCTLSSFQTDSLLFSTWDVTGTHSGGSFEAAMTDMSVSGPYCGYQTTENTTPEAEWSSMNNYSWPHAINVEILKESGAAAGQPYIKRAGGVPGMAINPNVFRQAAPGELYLPIGA